MDLDTLFSANNPQSSAKYYLSNGESYSSNVY